MKHNIQIRAPRFSQGGAGYTTPDTLEITIDGERLKCWKNSELFRAVANLINDRRVNSETLHALIDSATLVF